MGTPLRVLIVEDSEDDSLLMLRELRRAGYEPTSERVDTPAAMNAALDQKTWDIVLSDYAMPRFSMPAALAMVKERGLDLPFIIVSGAIGEEAAVAAMRAGAHDYVMKGNLARLAPAIERELRDAEVRRKRKQAEERIIHLNAVLRAIRNVNQLINKEKDRDRLLKGVCESLVETRGYHNVWACLLDGSAQFIASAEAGLGKRFAPMMERLKRGELTAFGRIALAQSDVVVIEDPPSACPDCPLSNSYAGRAAMSIRLEHAGKVYGLLCVSIPTEFTADDEERSLLREVAGDIALALYSAEMEAERKRAEEALWESEEKYRDVVERAHDGVAIVQDAIVRYVNPSFPAMLGYAPEEMIGTPMTDFVYPDELARAVDRYERRMAAETFKPTTELVLLNKDGSAVHVEVNAGLITFQGKPADLALIRDITERKRAEAALRESEAKYRDLVEREKDIIYTLDARGNITSASSAVRLLLAYGPEELIGKQYVELIPSEWREKTVKDFKSLLKTGEIVAETVLLDSKGEPHFVEYSSTTIEEDGKVVGTRGIVRDITERKQAEEALRESQEKLQRIFEAASDAIVVTDANGVICAANENAVLMSGFGSKSYILGKNAFEAIATHDRERAISDMGQLVKEGAVGTEEYALIRADGSEYPVEVSAGVLKDKAGNLTGFVNVIRDITERKRAEEERRRMEQQLQLAGRLVAVGELAAGVAHELNNPLAAVQAFAQLLNDRDDLDQAIKRDVETIYKEAQRATRITGNLLSFARRHKPEKRLISINDVIEKALELQAYQLKVNKIDLVMELDPDLPMTTADSHQMQQVFINIINNAEQAMIEAHGRGKLCVKTQKVGTMIRIAFTDDGPGISEENQKRMFDPFFTTKEVGRGTGLGLSICYGLVQEHGGRISVRSEPGKGATLVVEIPVVSEGERTAQEADSIRVEES